MENTVIVDLNESHNRHSISRVLWRKSWAVDLTGYLFFVPARPAAGSQECWSELQTENVNSAVFYLTVPCKDILSARQDWSQHPTTSWWGVENVVCEKCSIGNRDDFILNP